VIGSNGKTDLNLANSASIALSFYDADNKEIRVKNQKIDFYITRNSASETLDFKTFNASDVLSTNGSNSTVSDSQLIAFSNNLTSPNVSIHIHLKPSDLSMSYLFVFSYSQVPYLGELGQPKYDRFKIFCPPLLVSQGPDDYYSFFLNISSNVNLGKKIGYGLRELNGSEHHHYCENNNYENASSLPPILPGLAKPLITTEFGLRLFTSGCYYYDSQLGAWSSDGVDVYEDTNLTHTHCYSSHLTEFAGGMIILPPAIDFAAAFANSSFDKNPTIYITIILISCSYILLFIWCRWMDWKDKLKTRIHLLEDNSPINMYYYEMIVYTGGRNNAGTKSKVSFSLMGNLNEAVNRKLIPKEKTRILQRSSVDAFLFSVDR
jgi:hypothetical protein